MADNIYVVCISTEIGFYSPTTETLWSGVCIELAERYDKKTAFFIADKLIEAGYEETIVMPYTHPYETEKKE